MTASDTHNSRSDSRGCLGKGCLFGCLGTVVLAVVALIGAVTFGGPLIGERLERARKENPGLEFALAALKMLRGSESAATGEERSATGKSASGEVAGPGRSKRLPGVNDRSRLPADLPVYPQPVDEIFHIGSGDAAAFQRATRPRREVADWFRREMKTRGWSAVREVGSDRTDVAVYRKGKRSTRLEIADGEDGTEIWIRSTEAPTAGSSTP
jgi:hypothetical protein